MTQQSTASEVRQHGNCLDSPEREMLYAFADLLEAQEKAVPVAWRSLSLPTTFICDAPKNLDCEKWQPLYTHPSPSDAERLAEALHSIGERLSSVLCDPFGEVVVRGSDDDRQIIAQALKDLGELAAHSAQAHPPAASVTGAVEVSFEIWQDDEMVAECSGPEPSALHEARHYAAQYSQDGAVKLFRVSRVAISAAQENPNG